VALNPPTQYATDANLRARQRLWEHQQPSFDLVGWALDLAAAQPGQRVLDVGCGNGAYLRALRDRGVDAIGCDLSLGMLRAAASHRGLVNGSVTALPVATAQFDVVLAPLMLYHVDDREAAAHELRRVLRPGGVCIVITNGREHTTALRDLVEAAAREATPGWEMRNPSTHAFSLDNGAEQLAAGFDVIDVVRPDTAPVVLTDASIAADYVASVADHYQDEVDRPWAEVVASVRDAVQAVIDRDGRFVVRGAPGAFVCR
jgi:SAM-dependent methyltransferase